MSEEDGARPTEPETEPQSHGGKIIKSVKGMRTPNKTGRGGKTAVYPSDIRALARDELRTEHIKTLSDIAAGTKKIGDRLPTHADVARAIEILLKIGLHGAGSIKVSDNDVIRMTGRVALKYVPSAAHASFLADLEAGLKLLVDVGDFEDLVGDAESEAEDAGS